MLVYSSCLWSRSVKDRSRLKLATYTLKVTLTNQHMFPNLSSRLPNQKKEKKRVTEERLEERLLAALVTWHKWNVSTRDQPRTRDTLKCKLHMRQAGIRNRSHAAACNAEPPPESTATAFDCCFPRDFPTQHRYKSFCRIGKWLHHKRRCRGRWGSRSRGKEVRWASL
jgi:hypothetical protein